MSYPRGDGRTRLWVGVAGLPFEIGQRPGEMDDMLTGPAGDLQHETALRQNTSKDRQDRLFVSLCGRSGSALAHWPLPTHSKPAVEVVSLYELNSYMLKQTI